VFVGAAGDGEKVGIVMAEDKFTLRFKQPRPLQFLAKLRMNQVRTFPFHSAFFCQSNVCVLFLSCI
jgi:hypothetical protein